MRPSLAVRLTVLMTGILAASFGAWVAVVHRSTAVTFLDAREEILRSGDDDGAAERPVAIALEAAWAADGLAGVRRVAGDPAAAGLDPEIAFLVVGPDLDVLAATGPSLRAAGVERDGDGTIHVRAVRTDRDGTSALELARTAPPSLRGPDGASFGRLVVLPGPPEPAPGNRFAIDVWRSAAIGLVAVGLVAFAAAAFVLRRALAPIDRLTGAARELQRGRVPPPVAADADGEFRDLVEAFDAAVEAIDRTARLRRQWIADIAHELRTPVTNLRGQIEACEAGLIRPDGTWLETLGAETRVLQRLVEDFQQLAVSDAGELRLDPRPVPLGETVRNVLGPLARTAGADLEVDVADELEAIVDEERMRQILANLTDNAVRHRPDGLRIGVRARAQGDRVVLRFEDNGPGIAPADRPRVFERFWRADASRSRATGGAGLGLAIVQGLVEAMDGTIRCEAAEGGGAAFVIDLPRAVP